CLFLPPIILSCLLILRPRRSTPFPYTTLFRSFSAGHGDGALRPTRRLPRRADVPPSLRTPARQLRRRSGAGPGALGHRRAPGTAAVAGAPSRRPSGESPRRPGPTAGRGERRPTRTTQHVGTAAVAGVPSHRSLP